MNTSEQILQMLQERAASGPGAVKGYEGALSSARDLDRQGIEKLDALYSDPSKSERSVMGALGLGLMAPTKSGNFGEGMYNALSAATATKDYNQEVNFSREEKLAKLMALRAQLTRQEGEDALSVYDKQGAVASNMIGDRTQMADLELEGTPAIDGMEDDAAVRAEAIYNDYLENPQKYAGPQGQSMIKSSIAIMNNARTNKRYETVAGMKNQPGNRRLDKTDKTEIIKARGSNVVIGQTLNLLDEAEALGPKTMGGYFVGPRARAGAIAEEYLGVGDEDGSAKATLRYQQIMEGEAIKQMAETLKGATTDREMLKFIDIVADPTVPWENKKLALQQVRAFALALKEENDAAIKGIPDGSYYTGETGVDPSVANGGPDLEQVIGVDPNTGEDIRIGDVLQTAEELGITPEEVMQRLQSGGQ